MDGDGRLKLHGLPPLTRNKSVDPFPKPPEIKPKVRAGASRAPCTPAWTWLRTGRRRCSAGPCSPRRIHLRGRPRTRTRSATGATRTRPGRAGGRARRPRGRRRPSCSLPAWRRCPPCCWRVCRPATCSWRRTTAIRACGYVAEEHLSPHGVEVRLVPTATEAIRARGRRRARWCGSRRRRTRGSRWATSRPWRPPRTRRARWWRSTTRSPRRSASARSTLGADISDDERHQDARRALRPAARRGVGARRGLAEDLGAGARAGAIAGPFEAWLLHRSLATLDAAPRAPERQRARRGAFLAGRARRRAAPRCSTATPAPRPPRARCAASAAWSGFSLRARAARRRSRRARAGRGGDLVRRRALHRRAPRALGHRRRPEGFIRFSAGIEDPEDLVADVDARAPSQSVDEDGVSRRRARTVRCGPSPMSGVRMPGVSRLSAMGSAGSGGSPDRHGCGIRGSDDPWCRTGEPPSQCRLSLCQWRLPWRRRAPKGSNPSAAESNDALRAVGESLEKPWRAGSLPLKVDEGWEIRLCGPVRVAADGSDWTQGSRAARAACCSPTSCQPRSRLPARRADRRAVARAPAGGGRHGAERAAVEAAPRAGRRRGGRARRAPAAARAPVRSTSRRADGDAAAEAALERRDRARRRRAGPRRAVDATCRRSCPTADGGWAARAAPRAGRRSACAAWRRWPRPGCARAGASWGRPSRRRAPRSRWRRSASRRTSC